MEYVSDHELNLQMREIVSILDFGHVYLERISCIRSYGTKSRRTLARIHALSKALQKGMNIKAHYVIEIISENFDKLSEEEKVKTLIHELMHVPHNFGGGFRHHRPYVTKKTVEKMYKKYKENKQN